MKTFYFDAVTRAIADVTKPGELHTGHTITRINVPPEHRGKGLASRLLDEMCADADEEGAILWLQVSPDASGTGLDFEELTSFYRRRGFKAYDGFGTMVRRPR